MTQYRKIIFWNEVGCELSGNRHRKMESRALSNRAFHPNSSAMRLSDVPRDGKPQPGAANFARTPFVHAIEPLENAFLLGLWNSNSIIRHGENYFVAIPRCARNNVSARRRVLHRVIQQILQHITQT